MLNALARILGLGKSSHATARRAIPIHRERTIELLEGRELLSSTACVPALAARVAEVGSPRPMSAKPIANLAGTWDIHATSSGIDLTGTVFISQEGKLVTAEINLGGQTTDINGKVKKISLKGKGTFDIPGIGSVPNVKYTFTQVDATHFSGTATTHGVTINVTGVLQP